MARRRRAAPADAQAAAAALLASGAGAGDDATEPGRLDWTDRALIYELHRKGQSQTQIATILGCNQSTISRTLRLFEDSRDAARALLAGRAVQLAATVAETTDPNVALRTLAKLDVVRDDHQPGVGGITIVIGTPSAPLSLPEIPAGAGVSLRLATPEDDDTHDVN